MRGRELEDEPAAERVADPVGGGDAACVERLDEVCDVGRKGPRRLPARAPVAAQVGREHVEAPCQRSSASGLKRSPCPVTPWMQTSGGAPGSPHS